MFNKYFKKCYLLKLTLHIKSGYILKQSRTAIEIGSLDKNNLFIRHNRVHEQENYLYTTT